MMEVLVFVIGLPVSVVLLANLFALLDEPDKAAPLVRVAANLCILLALLLLLGRQYLYPLALALLTVALLYISIFYLARWFGLGVERYGDMPLQTPVETEDYGSGEEHQPEFENSPGDKEMGREGKP